MPRPDDPLTRIRCRFCEFWHRSKKEPKYGRCHLREEETHTWSGCIDGVYTNRHMREMRVIDH